MKLGAIDRFGTIYTELIPEIDKLILSADKWTYTNLIPYGYVSQSVNVQIVNFYFLVSAWNSGNDLIFPG